MGRCKHCTSNTNVTIYIRTIRNEARKRQKILLQTVRPSKRNTTTISRPFYYDISLPPISKNKLTLLRIIAPILQFAIYLLLFIYLINTNSTTMLTLLYVLHYVLELTIILPLPLQD